MPPKRTRNPPSASQPLPEATRPQRATRKRRASDASSVQSERPGSSQGTVTAGLSAPAKRRKTKRGGKGAASEEPEVIVEEDEVIVATEPEADIDEPRIAADDFVLDTQEDAADDMNDDGIEVSRSKSRHVHFGSDDIDVDKSTATHKTPHSTKTQVNKMAIKRRATISPTIGGSKRYKTVTQRTSLPASLSQEEEVETATAQEHHFASLREVLDDRIRHLLSLHRNGEQNGIAAHGTHVRHTAKELQELRIETVEKEKRIKELLLELERDTDEAEIDLARNEAVEAEIARLRAEVLANRARGHIDDLPDDDMMVIDSQQEGVSYPNLWGGQPKAPHTPTAQGKRSTFRSSLNASQALVVTDGQLVTATPGHKQWDAERRHFEDTIVVLAKEANDARTQLQIQNISLQALAFSTGEDVDSSVIIADIRDSFDSVREQMHSQFPGSVPEDATNRDLLEILFANNKEFADRLIIQDREHQRQIAHSTDLQVQVDKLIDHLAAHEIRIGTLQAQWKQLDEASDVKEREIAELEEALETAEEERDAFEAELKEKHAQLMGLETDNTNYQQSLDTLNASLRGYRDEESRLLALITKMEVDHRATVTKMNVEREATVNDLESKLDAETILRGEAERQADERQTTITNLEILIENTETQRDELTVLLEKTKTDLDAELAAREEAEAATADKDVLVNDLEARVGKLEDELDAITAELEELRTLNEVERRQREAAEQELDERNAEIEGLNTKLHDQGIQANSLRQKLFEVQTQNTERIKELEAAASDRDAQYQIDIGEEVGRREDAEEIVRIRDALIVDLQQDLITVNENMVALLAERDARIADLETALTLKDAEITRLQADLRTTEDMLSTERIRNQERQLEAEASIASLQVTINNHEATIKSLQRDSARAIALHDSEMEDRNASIATLNHNIAVHQDEISQLEAQKAGLERRVNEEAEQFLVLQADTSDEIDNLKAAILDKQAKILVVEEKAVEADRRWQEVLDARNEEIENMKADAQTTTETIEEMIVQSTSLKNRFRAYIHTTQDVVKNLQAELAKAKAKADQDGGALREEGDGLLEELESTDTVGEMKMTKKIVQTSSQASSSKKGAGGKKTKKRVYDSGFGVASDEMDESMLAS